MSHSGIQTPNAANMFDQLQLADIAAELPALPTEQLLPVLPIRSEWLRPEWFFFVSNTISINGVTRTWNDDGGSDFTNTYRLGGFNPGTGNGRSYHALSVLTSGTGTVTPILMQLYFQLGAAQTGVLSANANNAGLNSSRFTFPSFTVPPGVVVVLSTGNNGGAGDNMQVSGFGTSGAPGVPLLEGNLSQINAGP